MIGDGAKFEQFRQRQEKCWRLAYLALILIAVASFFVIGLAGSYLLGLIAMVAIVGLGFEGIRRWNRARWVQQFPELRDRRISWVRAPR
jgi:hypothetical protein